MKDKIYDIAIRYQGAISFVLVMFLLAIGAGLSVANANELPEGLNGENITIPVICGDTRVLYTELAETHGEYPVAIGFTTNDTAVVWFTNEDRTTLSIVIDTPRQSCMLYTTSCLDGDCYLTPKENFENEKEKLFPKNDSPKVSL